MKNPKTEVSGLSAISEVSEVSYAAGFTLIELLIVIAVIGVLTAIAIPQYSDYMLKGKLVPAFSALSTAQLRMEQYYQDNRAYGATSAACGILPATLGTVQNFTITCGVNKSNGLVCGAAPLDVQCFTYTATSTGLGTPEFVFTVDDSGAKNTSAVPTGWTNPGGCWVRSKGGC